MNVYSLTSADRSDGFSRSALDGPFVIRHSSFVILTP
jgi:hypothetical protein